MDGGSGLNLLYAHTLAAMKIPRSALRESKHAFYGVIPGQRAHPIGEVDLDVTFGERDNFRTERLTFQVIDFASDNHAILGRPAYAKFMAIPNYAYLKLKMPGPKGVITVGSSPVKALENERENRKIAELAVAKVELEEIQREIRAGAEAAALDSKKASPAGSFKPAEDSKTVPVDPNDPSKTVRIGTGLGPK